MDLKVIITKHALQRLLERAPRKFKKINENVIINTFENIIKNGRIIEGRDLLIFTSKYILVCAKSNDKIIIKTVMKTRDYKVAYEKLYKISRDSNWKNISFLNNRKRLREWLKSINLVE